MFDSTIFSEHLYMHIGFLLIIIGLIISIGFLVKFYLSNKKRSNLKIQKNIDQLKKINNVLRVKNKILEQFVFTTTHDLKTPLGSIYGFGSRIQTMIKRGEIKEEKLRIYVNFIMESIVQLSEIIEDSLEYGKTGQKCKIIRIDVKKLLKDLIGKSFMGYNDLTIINNNEVDALYSDYNQIYKVFQNLFENAYKFNDKDNKVIVISGKETESGYEFYVKDNGIGIEKKYYKKIFGLFQRLHGKDVPGTGLGLAIVKKNIDQLQGSIRIESEVGEYTTFHFTIPKT